MKQNLEEEKEIVDDATQRALDEYNLKRKANVSLEDILAGGGEVDDKDTTTSSMSQRTHKKSKKTINPNSDASKIREMTKNLTERHTVIAISKVTIYVTCCFYCQSFLSTSEN